MLMEPVWLRRVASCASTNDWARERLSNLSHGDVVYTEQQTAGKGQHGRKWLAPPGTLTASFVVKVATTAHLECMGLIAGLALVHAIEDHLPQLACRIKWPNDCYLNDRKLAGILCEGRSHHAGFDVVVGIGCNLSSDPKALAAADVPDLARPPISLREVATPPTALQLIDGIRRYLHEGVGLVQAQGLAPLLPQLQQRDWLNGRTIHVTHGQNSLLGTAAGIAADGQLLLRDHNNTLHHIRHGHITERPSNTVENT